MANKNYDVDTILKGALRGSEKPSPKLITKLKKESYTMKKRRFVKPSIAIAVALIAALSVSVIAFAAAPIIWRYLDTRVVQGEEFLDLFSVRVSEDGTMSVWSIVFDSEAIQNADDSAVIVEVDGVTMVLRDELHFNNVEEALNLLSMDNILMPSFLPEGFIFEQATFPINPITHPDELGASGHMFVDYTNGEDTIRVQAMQWNSGNDVGFFSPSQVDVVINGNNGAVTEGILAVIIDNVFYNISTSEYSTITTYELIKIAESLQ